MTVVVPTGKVAPEAKPAVNVRKQWESYETSIIVANSELFKKLGTIETGEELLDYTKRQIIIKLEKFARAISRQFTLGKLGEKALVFSSVLNKPIFKRLE